MQLVNLSNHEYSIEDIKTFLKDWQGFQSELKTLKKENNVSFKTTNYNYITIDEILAYTRPLLKKYNLSFMQEAECREDTTEVKSITYIMHSTTGIIIQIDGLFVPGGNDAQRMGAGFTYASRYGLTKAFGIGTSDDDDAVSISNDNAQPKKKPSYEKPMHQQKSIDTPTDEEIQSAALLIREMTADDISNCQKVYTSITNLNYDKATNAFIKKLNKIGLKIDGNGMIYEPINE